MIRRDAGLSGVQELAPRNPLRGKIQLGVGIDNAGTLSAEFKRKRSEVLRRGTHHGASAAGPACIENVVEFFFQQTLRDVDAAVEDCHVFRLEDLAHNRFNDFRRVFRLFRRLENHPVARGNRADQRSERQLKRIVPRRKNQNVSIRFRTDAPLCREVQKRSPDFFHRYVRRQFFDHRRQFVEHNGDLGRNGFKFALPEVEPQSFADHVLTLADFAEEPAQSVEPDVDIQCGESFLRFENLRYAVHCLTSAFLFRNDFEPVAVGILAEINAHVFVFKADVAHFFVECVRRFKIIDDKRQVELVLAEIVRLLAVAEPRQFKLMRAGAVLQIHDNERAVPGVDSAHFMHVEGVTIELETFVKIKHIEVVVNHPEFHESSPPDFSGNIARGGWESKLDFTKTFRLNAKGGKSAKNFPPGAQSERTAEASLDCDLVNLGVVALRQIQGQNTVLCVLAVIFSTSMPSES